MASYQAQIKNLDDFSLIDDGTASFEKMWSQNPLEPKLQIIFTLKGIRTELNNTDCILWISEKENGRVTLILVDYYADTNETKFQAIPIGVFPHSDK
jgi:hypothetical protein